jgi:hypothetical protein
VALTKQRSAQSPPRDILSILDFLSNVFMEQNCFNNPLYCRLHEGKM